MQHPRGKRTVLGRLPDPSSVASVVTLVVVATLASSSRAGAQLVMTIGPFGVHVPSTTPAGAARVILGTMGKVATSRARSRSAARVVPTAERYLGTPYRWGGTSPVTGFDCSGFVQFVFSRNSVKLPRTSRQQAKVGVAMPRSFSRLAPGDLVMFAEPGEPISHVAIYAGQNRIIHASSSGGSVRYDDLGTRRGRWFVDHMVAARRVTPNGQGLMLDLVKSLDPRTLADTALDIGDLAPRP